MLHADNVLNYWQNGTILILLTSHWSPGVQFLKCSNFEMLWFPLIIWSSLPNVTCKCKINRLNKYTSPFQPKTFCYSTTRNKKKEKKRKEKENVIYIWWGDQLCVGLRNRAVLACEQANTGQRTKDKETVISLFQFECILLDRRGVKVNPHNSQQANRQ